MKVRSGAIKDSTGLLRELAAIIPDDRTFQAEFATFRLTRTRISRYLLRSLECSLRGTKEPEMVPNANEDEVNLEHILPRNAKPAEWPTFDPEELGPWANRFGNHCLLKKSENAKIGNKPWSAKKPTLTASSLRLTKRAGKKLTGRRQRSKSASDSWPPVLSETWPRNP